MHSTYLRRTTFLLPLLIFAAVNILSAYYPENLYNFNTFARAGKVIISQGNPYALP